jgi:D-alanyl-D-alanine carboxypeptidase
MRDTALRDDVVLVMISGFRSFEQQLQLIRARLAESGNILSVLEILAPPGCSEHHTGRAADIGTPGCQPLSETFEETPAFQWLGTNAAHYGFQMTYPRGNRWGYRYEPWHWCFDEASVPR